MKIEDVILLAGAGFIGWKIFDAAGSAVSEAQGRPVYWPLVVDAANAANIPPAILGGIVNHESSWSNAPSMSRCHNGDTASASCKVPCTASCAPTCAIGLAQLKAKYFAPGGDATALCDPATNLMIAARLLRDLYSRFRDWNVAVVAYNQGAGAVDNEIKAGRDPIALNSDYVRKVGAAAERYGGGALAGLAFAARPSLFRIAAA
jgi:soluble lytic murein transglycosylase-like protein